MTDKPKNSFEYRAGIAGFRRNARRPPDPSPAVTDRRNAAGGAIAARVRVG
jgi:hypothetical protein